MAYDDNDWLITWLFQTGIQQWEITSACESAASVVTNSGDELAETVFNLASDHLMDRLSNHTTLIKATIRRANNLAEVYEFTGDVDGALDSGDPMPPSICMVAKLLTSTPGRRGRGRWFIAGLGNSDRDDYSTWASSRTTAMAGAIEDMLEFNSGSPVPTAYKLAVHSRLDEDLRHITGVSCSTLMGTQKRRLRVGV